jgi:hypothetical protein
MFKHIKQETEWKSGKNVNLQSKSQLVRSGYGGLYVLLLS